VKRTSGSGKQSSHLLKSNIRGQDAGIRSSTVSKRRRSAYGEGQGYCKWPQQRGVPHSNTHHQSHAPKGRRHSPQDPNKLLTIKRIWTDSLTTLTIWQNLADHLDALSKDRLEMLLDLKQHSGGNNSCMPQAAARTVQVFLLPTAIGSDPEGQARLATPEELNIQISLRQR
jgi:hypothetical protein